MPATSNEAGITELRNNLGRYLDRVRDGEEVIVTVRGRPVARLSPLRAAEDRLAELIEAGLARPPISQRRPPPEPVAARGTVSDLIIDHRR